MTTKAEAIAENIKKMADRGEAYATEYTQKYLAGEEPTPDYAVTDLLGDLRHYCDRQGWDWDGIVAGVEDHHQGELEGEFLDYDEEADGQLE